VNPRGGEVERGVGVDTFIARFSDEVAETAERALNA
jgi:threonyl-tRNA synthetase